MRDGSISAVIGAYAVIACENAEPLRRAFKRMAEWQRRLPGGASITFTRRPCDRSIVTENMLARTFGPSLEQRIGHRPEGVDRAAE
jgi:hypothetical protein